MVRVLRLFLPCILLMALTACNDLRPVTLDAQPVVGEQTARFARALDTSVSSMLLVSTAVEQAFDRGLIPLDVFRTYVETIDTPARLAHEQARDVLITYEQTHAQDALTQFAAYLADLTALLARALDYAHEHGLLMGGA